MTSTPDPGNPTDCRDLDSVTSDQEEEDNMLPATLWLDETETNVEAGSHAEAAIRELQAYIEPLGRFFTFGRYVKSMNKVGQGGKYKWILHMGKAKCMQAMCMAKGRKNAIAYSTLSRDHLKTHYKRLHGDAVHKVEQKFYKW